MGKAAQARSMVRREHLIFWLTKVTYIFIYILLPIIFVGWLETLIGFIIVSVVCGFSISIVFQLAHVVEGTEFPEPDADTHKIQKEWAVHQVSTTANFAIKSKITYWLLGGLNFQVKHHLYPGISHHIYTQINNKVKEN